MLAGMVHARLNFEARCVPGLSPFPVPHFPRPLTTRCHILAATCRCWLQVVQKVEYPIWVVYVTQALMFGGGLAGISYGILSTSWDPRREGSALGWTELQVTEGRVVQARERASLSVCVLRTFV